MRLKLIGGVLVAVLALALLWRFFSGPKDIPLPRAPESPIIESNILNERTLVGTKWERQGFGFEFGADGKLLIGGRERAQWRVEGSRLRLYRETTGEEHWLDIVSNRLMWKDKEIGRVP